jgi:hypothetical protein
MSEEVLADLSSEGLYLRIHHDDDAEVYLNGTEIAASTGYTTDYQALPLSPAVLGLLQPGTNLLAVHVRQTGGGQYIDVGLVEWIEP